jgi:branched-chain amino acid transport system ATP-binding protein
VTAKSSEPAVEVRDLTVHFGGVLAVDRVSFAIAQGSITGFIGPNGAGKTTIFDAISGFVASEGTVMVEGRDVTSRSAAGRASVGLGRSFQDGRLFGSLTVGETLAVALSRHGRRIGPLNAAVGVGPSRSAERELAVRVDELIDSMRLAAFRDKFCAELSTGTRRLVDLACAIAHAPAVLLLDEPSSGIAQRETEALGAVLKQVQRTLRCTVLVIEHDMPLVSSISDELIALETGVVIARGSPRDVLDDPAVIDAYLGADERAIFRSGAGGRTRRGRRRRARPTIDRA